MCARILTSAWVVPARTLVYVVDVIDLSLGGDGLLPPRGEGRVDVGEGEGGPRVGRAEGLRLVQRRGTHRLARVLPCVPMVGVTETKINMLQTL